MFVIESSALLQQQQAGRHRAAAPPAAKCIYPTAISIIHITNFCSTARLVKRKWQVTTVNIDKSIEHQQSHSKLRQRRRMSDSLRKLSFPRSFDGAAAVAQWRRHHTYYHAFPVGDVSVYVCRPSEI